MGEHLDTLAALRAVAAGRRVPGQKYAALQRASLIRVIGHGAGSKPKLTEAGEALLAQGGGIVTAEPRTRDESVALIADHLGVSQETPRRRGDLLDRAFRSYGYGMLTDEAIAFLAGWCEADRTYADRLDAARRKLAETGAAERAMARAQREAGDLLAENHPIPSSTRSAA